MMGKGGVFPVAKRKTLLRVVMWGENLPEEHIWELL